MRSCVILRPCMYPGCEEEIDFDDMMCEFHEDNHDYDITDDELAEDTI